MITNHGRLTKRGYYKHSRTLKTEHIVTAAQRSSLMISMSLSETAEVANRGSSEILFDDRVLAATKEVIFMSSVQLRYYEPTIFRS